MNINESLRPLFLCLIFMLIAAVGKAQHTFALDTTYVYHSKFEKFSRSTLGNATFVCVPLGISSLFMRQEDNHFTGMRPDYMPTKHIENWNLQLLPLASLYGMKIAGVKSATPWDQMLTAHALGAVFMCGAVQALKHTTDVCRPDGSDDRSYPSGHTATAFMTATMLHHEYGERYPWLSVLGYSTATATGYYRIARNRHALSDVMAGASIGIMATELGYFFSDLIFKKPALTGDIYEGDDKDYKPSFIGYHAGINIPLGSYQIAPGSTIKTSSGSTIGIEGAWFATRHIGIGGQFTMSEHKCYVNHNIAQSLPLKYKSALVGPYIAYPIGNLFSFGVNGVIGYTHYNPFEVTGSNGDVLYKRGHKSGMSYGAGLSLTARAQRHISYKLLVDYVNRSPLGDDTQRLSTMSIGLQMAYAF